MKWNTVLDGDTPLTHDEECERIYSAYRMLQALTRGDQQITPRVITALRMLAEQGLFYMVMWHEAIHHNELMEVDQAQRAADATERIILNIINNDLEKPHVH